MKSDKQPHEHYVVVDVRDDDYRGGNIKGSVNHPSETFLDKVHEVVEATKDVPTVVFHCALSQQRGPKAARIYAETFKNLQHDREKQVLILQGGFTEFQQRYRNDPELVENWDKSVWMYHF